MRQNQGRRFAYFREPAVSEGMQVGLSAHVCSCTLTADEDVTGLLLLW